MELSAASSIVSYGGAANSHFFTTPLPPFLQGYYRSPHFRNVINACAPYQVERIRTQLTHEEENGLPPLNEPRRGALYCRSGTWLELLPYEDEEDGSTKVKVHGTREESKFSIVEFVSVAMSLISIRGVETKNFVCMDPSGKLYATPSSNFSRECVFVEEMMENYYNLYASCLYGNQIEPWYLEIRKSGKPRKGPKSKKRRKASHFLVVHHEVDRLKHGVPNGDDVSNLVAATMYHRPPTHPLFRPLTTKPPNPHRISNLRAKVEITNEKVKAQLLLDAKKLRKKKKPRRREDRLRREEAQREARRQELKRLRAEEVILNEQRRIRFEEMDRQAKLEAAELARAEARHNYPDYRAPTQRPPQYPTSSPPSYPRLSGSGSSARPTPAPPPPRAAYNPYHQPPTPPPRYTTTTPAPAHRHHHHHHHHEHQNPNPNNHDQYQQQQQRLEQERLYQQQLQKHQEQQRISVQSYSPPSSTAYYPSPAQIAQLPPDDPRREYYQKQLQYQQQQQQYRQQQQQNPQITAQTVSNPNRQNVQYQRYP